VNSDDLAKFFKTAIELYNLWPSFFYSVAGLIIPITLGLITVTWRMRGFKADTEQERLKGNMEVLEKTLTGQIEVTKTTLNGQIALLKEHLAFAKEQQGAAQKEAENLKAQLTEFKPQLTELVEKGGRKAFADIQNSTAVLESTLGRLLSANNAVSVALTPPSGELRATTGSPTVTVTPGSESALPITLP